MSFLSTYLLLTLMLFGGTIKMMARICLKQGLKTGKHLFNPTSEFEVESYQRIHSFSSNSEV